MNIPEDAGIRRRDEISYPFSNGFGFSGDELNPLTVEVMKCYLTEGSVPWHVKVLATAPEPKNPKAVRAVRGFAETFSWTNQEVIAGLPVNGGGLSGEEYDW